MQQFLHSIFSKSRIIASGRHLPPPEFKPVPRVSSSNWRLPRLVPSNTVSASNHGLPLNRPVSNRAVGWSRESARKQSEKLRKHIEKKPIYDQMAPSKPGISHPIVLPRPAVLPSTAGFRPFVLFHPDNPSKTRTDPNPQIFPNFAVRCGPCLSPKTSGWLQSLAFGDREMQYPGRALPFSRKRETEHSPGWKTLVRIHPLPRRPCGPPRPNHSGQIRAQLHCEQNPNKQCIISDLSSYPLQNQRTFQKNG